MDNAVLVSGEQQNGSVIHIHTRISPLFFFFRFFSHIGHYRVLRVYVLINPFLGFCHMSLIRLPDEFHFEYFTSR